MVQSIEPFRKMLGSVLFVSQSCSKNTPAMFTSVQAQCMMFLMVTYKEKRENDFRMNFLRSYFFSILIWLELKVHYHKKGMTGMTFMDMNTVMVSWCGESRNIFSSIDKICIHLFQQRYYKVPHPGEKYYIAIEDTQSCTKLIETQ